MVSILFVCTGNTCRSLIAEMLFKKMLADKGIKNINVRSAGTDSSPSFQVPPIVKKIIEENDCQLEEHIASSLTPKLVHSSDFILVMEREHQEKIENIYPEAKNKIFLLKEFPRIKNKKELDIYDPIGLSDETYRVCAQKIKECLENIIEEIDEILTKEK